MENTRNLSILTDNSVMPFGKFTGEKMANVPYWHLLWLHKDQGGYVSSMRKQHPEVFTYIEENLDSLLSEKKRNTKNYDVDTSSMFNS